MLAVSVRVDDELALGKNPGDLPLSEFAAGPALATKIAPPGTEELLAFLSPRQRQTLLCLLMGYSEKQIAMELGISQHTIHVYIKAIYRAFDVCSRGELFTMFLSPEVQSLLDGMQRHYGVAPAGKPLAVKAVQADQRRNHAGCDPYPR